MTISGLFLTLGLWDKFITKFLTEEIFQNKLNPSVSSCVRRKLYLLSGTFEQLSYYLHNGHLTRIKETVREDTKLSFNSGDIGSSPTREQGVLYRNIQDIEH